MSESPGFSIKTYWERYLPCRLHKKNIVLMGITVACFGLVIWTVVVTVEAPERPQPSNFTDIVIEDQKELKFLNLTTATDIANAKAAARPTPKPRVQQIFLKDIYNPEAEETICKCLCQGEKTKAEMARALMAEMQVEENMKKAMTKNMMQMSADTEMQSPMIFGNKDMTKKPPKSPADAIFNILSGKPKEEDEKEIEMAVAEVEEKAMNETKEVEDEILLET